VSGRPLALVTGGSSGIGLALAERLAGRGMTVLLVARGAERLERVAASLPGSEAIVADIADEADRERLVAAVRRRGRRLDLLVNNAGIGGGTTAVDIDVARVARVLEVNFLGYVGLTRALWPELVATGGRVVNVSSGLGTYVHPGSAGYAASKHAVTAWSRVLGVQGRRQGVRVLTLHPGPVVTDQFRHEGLRGRRFARHLLVDTGRCAEDALRGLDRGRAEVWSHPAFRVLAVAQSLAPGFFARHIAPRAP
jgi:short-subunit dehydrogenase